MACGFIPFGGPLTGPFIFNNFVIVNPGTPAAFFQFDSNDFFGNGLFDDNTTAGAFGLSYATCGSPAPAVSITSRNRVTLAAPGATTVADVLFTIFTTWTGTVYYKNGAVTTPIPTFTNPVANIAQTLPIAGNACNDAVAQPAIVVNTDTLT